MSQTLEGLESQIEDMQVRLAYQEDTLNQLNEVISSQDQSIGLLQQQVRILAKKLDEMNYRNEPGAAGDVADERPPHY